MELATLSSYVVVRRSNGRTPFLPPSRSLAPVLYTSKRSVIFVHVCENLDDMTALIVVTDHLIPSQFNSTMLKCLSNAATFPLQVPRTPAECLIHTHTSVCSLHQRCNRESGPLISSPVRKEPPFHFHPLPISLPLTFHQIYNRLYLLPPAKERCVAFGPRRSFSLCTVCIRRFVVSLGTVN